MSFNFSQTAGTSGITTITVSATSREELSYIVENFTLSNDTVSVLMPVAQKAYEPVEKYIIFQPNSMSVESSGGTSSLNIQSNDAWEIVSDDWIQLSRYDSESKGGYNSLIGDGNTIIGIRCAENTGNTRNGGISGYCKSDSAISATTTVQQSGSYVKPYLALGQYQYNIESSGQSGCSLAVVSNVDWTVTTDARWITINTTGGTGNGTISFDVQGNEQTIERRATITVSSTTESVFAECIAIQAASAVTTPYIIISPTGQTVSLKGGSFTISVSSNTDWNVTAITDSQLSRPWISVDKLNGYGDDEVVVTIGAVGASEEIASRSGYISFYNNTQGLKTECDITQESVIEYVDYIFIDGGLATDPKNRIYIDYTPTQNTEFVLKGNRSDLRTNYATVSNANILGNGNTYKFGWYGYSRPNSTPLWSEEFLINGRSIDWSWYTWLDRSNVNATIGWFYIKDYRSGSTQSTAIEDPISVDVGSWKFHSLDIYESGTLVFSGVAAVVDGEIGIYDTISHKLLSNPNLVMTYQ